MSSLSKLLSDVWSTLTGIHAELRAIRQLLEVPPPPVNDEGAAKLAGCHVRTIRNIFSDLGEQAYLIPGAPDNLGDDDRASRSWDPRFVKAWYGAAMKLRNEKRRLHKAMEDDQGEGTSSQPAQESATKRRAPTRARPEASDDDLSPYELSELAMRRARSTAAAPS